jgi:outer membrane protein
MKQSIGLAAAVLATFMATSVVAQENTWMVRARILNMDVDNGNSPSVAGAAVSINNKTFPEFDIVHNFTKNISAELVLTYPQKHDVKLNGSNIGTIKHLPPVLTLQYQFNPGQTINPYVGAGINYTRFMSANLPAGITTDKSSVGFAAQLGVDFEIAKNTYINLDYKRVNIRTDVKVNGAKLTELRVDPNLFSVGVGFRF